MQPTVRRLEQKFDGSLFVIGVHAGKFHRERDSGAIRLACTRLGVRHPVVNDRQFRTWRDHSVPAWPTVTIIDPQGYVIGQQSGELPYAGLESFIEDVRIEHERRGTLQTESPGRTEVVEPTDAGGLRFPGDVAADIEGRLIVADTGNHRILAGRGVGQSFEVEHVIGSGEPGFADGSFSGAAFNEPRGLALSGDMIIIADRGNHAIRMVDLTAGVVGTMAGTGEIGSGAIEAGEPLGTSLRSPWDVLLWDYDLFIAMAGTHQIWRLDMKDRTLVPHAGTGAEAIVDGPADEAALAQPMALATDGERLYFADAETSSIRWVGFAPGSEVSTLVGTGLFEFGDVDGVGEDVRLQHPGGVAWGAGLHRLWIADSYNNKLKTLDPPTRTVETVEPFPELDEPMGLAPAGHQMFVADTNHHRVLRVDEIDKRVIELEMLGVG